MGKKERQNAVLHSRESSALVETPDCLRSSCQTFCECTPRHRELKCHQGDMKAQNFYDKDEPASFEET